jgi:type VI secretion system protein ImpC
MTYLPDFGRFGPDLPPAGPRPAGGTRIVLLGDYAGRAHRGELRDPQTLARLKPIRLDVDTLDRVIAGFATTLHLPVGADGSMVEVPLRALDDLHPDALCELPVFAELTRLRAELAYPATARHAADEVRAWLAGAGEMAPALQSTARRARGNSLRVDARLDDFARLVARPAAAVPVASPLAQLLRAAVAPHVVEADVPDAQALTAAIDHALSATLRALLHHPDFQCLESAWRSLEFVARRIRTHARLEVVVYDISAEEFAADLAAAACLEDSALYRLLVDEAALDAQQGLPSAIVADYRFEMTPPHAELLGRAAQIAARANAPFFAALGVDALATRDEDLHPIVVDAWAALRALPAAAWLALTAPRFLLRAPYGERGEPVDAFEFEEFDPREGLRTLLWGHAPVLAAVLLAGHVDATGRLAAPGRLLTLPDMPWFTFADADGDTTTLPCTERLWTERQAAQVQARGVVPVLSIKGRPEVRLAGFRALAGGALAGPWMAAPTLPMPGAVAVAAAAIDAARRSVDVAPEVAERAADPAVDGAPDANADAAADQDLEALLASLGEREESPPEAPSDSGFDPELEALLKAL